MAISIKFGNYTLSSPNRPATWEEIIDVNIAENFVVNKDGKKINRPTKLDKRQITITGKLVSATLETAMKNFTDALFRTGKQKLWLFDDQYVYAEAKSYKFSLITDSMAGFSVTFVSEDPFVYGTSLSYEDFAISGDTLTAVHTSADLGKTKPVLKIFATAAITTGFTVQKTDGETISQTTATTAGTSIGAAVGTTAGQTFTTTKSGVLTKISAKLSLQGTPAGNIRIVIKATSAGVPTGDVLAESDYISALAINGEFLDFIFRDKYNLEAATQYAYYYEYTWTPDGVNFVQQTINVGNPYADGTVIYYNGSAWSTQVANDTGFEITTGEGDTETITIDQALVNGDELEIDCENLTVELNGTSILDKVGIGSDIDLEVSYGGNNFNLAGMGGAATGIFRIEYTPRRY